MKKKQQPLLFYLSPTCICNGICYWLRDELNLVKILSAILIFVGVYLVTSSPKALREKNRLHMKKLLLLISTLLINETDFYFKHKMFTFLEFIGVRGLFTIFALF
jgi:drug/metabolite transporter (DMT)-like permease